MKKTVLIIAGVLIVSFVTLAISSCKKKASTRSYLCECPSGNYYIEAESVMDAAQECIYKDYSCHMDSNQK